MQHRPKCDSCAETRTPSLQFVCAIAILLKSDPTELLRELGYSLHATGTDAKMTEGSCRPSQDMTPEYSENYLG